MYYHYNKQRLPILANAIKQQLTMFSEQQIYQASINKGWKDVDVMSVLAYLKDMKE